MKNTHGELIKRESNMKLNKKFQIKKKKKEKKNSSSSPFCGHGTHYLYRLPSKERQCQDSLPVKDASWTPSWTHFYPVLLGRELWVCSSRGSYLHFLVTSIVTPNTLDSESFDNPKDWLLPNLSPILMFDSLNDIP